MTGEGAGFGGVWTVAHAVDLHTVWTVTVWRWTTVYSYAMHGSNRKFAVVGAVRAPISFDYSRRLHSPHPSMPDRSST